MNLFYRSLVVLGLGVAVLPAQGFTGTIEGRVLSAEAPPQYLRWSVRGPQTVLDITDEGDQVSVQRVIFDRSTRIQWEQGYVHGDRTRGAPAPVPDTIPNLPLPELQPQGPGDPVVGRECDNYSFMADGYQLSGCFSDDLGPFVAPRVRGPLGIPQPAGVPPVYLGFPNWALAINGVALFPLKVWDASGQTLFEIKRITDGGLPACFYELPRNIPTSNNPLFGIKQSSNQRAPAGGRGSVAITLIDGRQINMQLPPTVSVPRGTRLPSAPDCTPPRRGRGGGGGGGI